MFNKIQKLPTMMDEQSVETSIHAFIHPSMQQMSCIVLGGKDAALYR
jgi:hypothetical protein